MVIELKTADEIELMRQAGRVTAAALAAVREAAAVGVRLDELDEVAAEVCADAGAEALFLGYRPGSAPTPYPGVICISVNDAVVHGIPGRYRLRGRPRLRRLRARYRGWSGDAALSFIVGEHPDPRVTGSDQALIATTRAALDAGIAAARPGARLGDIAHAIGRVARAAGYGLMANYGGHGIGREMHEAPARPQRGPPRPRPRAAPRAGPRARAHAHHRRHRRLRTGPRRLDPAHRRRQPRRPHRAHRRRHRARPRGPHPARENAGDALNRPEVC